MAKDTLNDTVSSFLQPVLTADELEKIQTKAREAVMKEQHDKLFSEALAEATKAARVAAGLVADPGAVPEEELVEVRMNLPDCITPRACLSTNGRDYWHGQTYRVNAATAIDLASRQWMAWVQDGRIKGTWSDVNRPKPMAVNMATGGFVGHMPISIGGR